MLCPPTMRPASPAESEISVGGAPSPLPTQLQLQHQHPHQHHPLSHAHQLHHPRASTIDLLQQQQILMQHHAAAAAAAAAGLTRGAVGSLPEDYFQPLKRLRMSSSSSEPREHTPSPPALAPAAAASESQPQTTTKAAIEGVKSFSIADILGHSQKQRSESVSPPPAATLLAPPANRPSSGLLQPRTEPLDAHHAAAAMLLPGGQIVRPWDHLLGPMPVRPFIPSALLHYEQRLALDYHRQLQEHFNAQAQLLRHMGMDIIPSESGSDRSSSAASDCCSPEISRDSAAAAAAAAARHSPQSSAQVTAERERHHSAGSASASSPSQNSSGASSGGNAAAVAAAAAKAKANGTPLDALFQMTTKDFDESQDKSHLDIFSNRPQPKKKRKSRTAFTNHQIFELEKRFLYQKYLSPADRDEIAASLGLSNAQVITWFQNRRAKQKRDIEELKKDFDSVKVFSAHKSFLENVNDLSILKKKPMHEADMVGLAAAAAAAGMVTVQVPGSAGSALGGAPPK